MCLSTPNTQFNHTYLFKSHALLPFSVSKSSSSDGGTLGFEHPKGIQACTEAGTAPPADRPCSCTECLAGTATTVTAGSAGIAGCGRRTQGNGLNDQSEDWPGMARTASAGTLGTAHRSRRGNKAGLRNPSRISFACVAAWGSSAGNHCKLARSRSALESSLANGDSATVERATENRTRMEERADSIHGTRH